MRPVLRWLTLFATGMVVAGFVLFAAEEVGEESGKQVARVDESLPAEAVAAESVREAENGPVREFVEDANDVLLAPFENVVDSGDIWVQHGVPALLALLVYGALGTLLLNYLVPNRR